MRHLVLASASPRRRELLRLADFRFEVHVPDFDDGLLDASRHDAESWVLAMAFMKARRVADQRAQGAEVILGADTVCVDEQSILGKPRDANDAHQMIRRLRSRRHRTLTGVCLVYADTGARTLLLDEAQVDVGLLTDAAIDAYVASGDWQGKAGGYNFADRVAAGWPVRCVGDESSVMGLPMGRLTPVLRAVINGNETAPHELERTR